MKKNELIEKVMNERDFDFLCEKKGDKKELEKVKALFKKRLELRVAKYSEEELDDYLKVTRGQMDSKAFDLKWPENKTKEEIANELVEGKDWSDVAFLDKVVLKIKLKKKILKKIADFSENQLRDYLSLNRHDIDEDEYREKWGRA